MYIKLKPVFAIFLLGIFLQSCGKSDPKPEPELKFRTVIVYLAGNNSLSDAAETNMEQMEQGVAGIDGNMIVYAKQPGKNPAIYEIKPTGNGGTGKTKVKDYSAHDSSNPTVMAQVLADIQQLYPARTYGLILWSHATGWIPANYGSIKMRSFGDDGGSKMDIHELNEALPNNFDFIMFDACSMASVEVLYELKDKTKHFIASPGEVIENGMPYDKITKDLFIEGAKSYTEVAKKYFAHYDALEGNYRSATVSVVDASKLENLAQQTNATISSQQARFADFNRDNIQRMDFDRTGNALISFDFLDFMQYNYDPIVNIVEAMRQAVVYKANTEEFNGYEIRTNSGLSSYIPHPDNEQKAHGFYRTLKWYKAAGYDKLF